jgi:hypothetical protein
LPNSYRKSRPSFEPRPASNYIVDVDDVVVVVVAVVVGGVVVVVVAGVVVVAVVVAGVVVVAVVVAGVVAGAVSSGGVTGGSTGGRLILYIIFVLLLSFFKRMIVPSPRRILTLAKEMKVVLVRMVFRMMASCAAPAAGRGAAGTGTGTGTGCAYAAVGTNPG